MSTIALHSTLNITETDVTPKCQTRDPNMRMSAISRKHLEMLFSNNR